MISQVLAKTSFWLSTSYQKVRPMRWLYFFLFFFLSSKNFVFEMISYGLALYEYIDNVLMSFWGHYWNKVLSNFYYRPPHPVGPNGLRAGKTVQMSNTIIHLWIPTLSGWTSGLGWQPLTFLLRFLSLSLSVSSSPPTVLLCLSIIDSSSSSLYFERRMPIVLLCRTPAGPEHVLGWI